LEIIFLEISESGILPMGCLMRTSLGISTNGIYASFMALAFKHNFGVGDVAILPISNISFILCKVCGNKLAHNQLLATSLLYTQLLINLLHFVAAQLNAIV